MFRTGERLFDCNQCSIVFEPITNDNFANTSTKSAHVDYLLTLKENAAQTAILSSSITSSLYTHKLPFLFPYASRHWDSISIHNNGFVSFGNTVAPSFLCGEQAIRGSTMQSIASALDCFTFVNADEFAAICVFWNVFDLTTCEIKVEESSTSLRIAWCVCKRTDNRTFESKGANRFELLLDHTGRITLRYDNVSECDAIVGLFSMDQYRCVDVPLTLCTLVPKLQHAPARLLPTDVQCFDVDSLIEFRLRWAASLIDTAAQLDIAADVTLLVRDAETKRNCARFNVAIRNNSETGGDVSVLSEANVAPPFVEASRWHEAARVLRCVVPRTSIDNAHDLEWAFAASWSRAADNTEHAGVTTEQTSWSRFHCAWSNESLNGSAEESVLRGIVDFYQSPSLQTSSSSSSSNNNNNNNNSSSTITTINTTNSTVTALQTSAGGKHEGSDTLHGGDNTSNKFASTTMHRSSSFSSLARVPSVPDFVGAAFLRMAAEPLENITIKSERSIPLPIKSSKKNEQRGGRGTKRGRRAGSSASSSLTSSTTTITIATPANNNTTDSSTHVIIPSAATGKRATRGRPPSKRIDTSPSGAKRRRTKSRGSASTAPHSNGSTTSRGRPPRRSSPTPSSKRRASSEDGRSNSKDNQSAAVKKILNSVDASSPVILDKAVLQMFGIEDFEEYFGKLTALKTLSSTEQRDVQRQRRLLKNRQSAQSSRQKRKIYIESLEKRVSELESENKRLSTQLAKRGIAATPSREQGEEEEEEQDDEEEDEDEAYDAHTVQTTSRYGRTTSRGRPRKASSSSVVPDAPRRASSPPLATVLATANNPLASPRRRFVAFASAVTSYDAPPPPQQQQQQQQLQQQQQQQQYSDTTPSYTAVVAGTPVARRRTRAHVFEVFHYQPVATRLDDEFCALLQQRAVSPPPHRASLAAVLAAFRADALHVEIGAVPGGATLPLALEHLAPLAALPAAQFDHRSAYGRNGAAGVAWLAHWLGLAPPPAARVEAVARAFSCDAALFSAHNDAAMTRAARDWTCTDQRDIAATLVLLHAEAQPDDAALARAQSLATALELYVALASDSTVQLTVQIWPVPVSLADVLRK